MENPQLNLPLAEFFLFRSEQKGDGRDLLYRPEQKNGGRIFCTGGNRKTVEGIFALVRFFQ